MIQYKSVRIINLLFFFYKLAFTKWFNDPKKVFDPRLHGLQLT